MPFMHKLGLSLFLLWLCSGMAGLALSLSGNMDMQRFAQAELRTPAEFPPLPRGRGVKAFFSGVESWFTDRVYARQQYLALYNTLGLQSDTGLQNSSVIRGRGSWLYLGNLYDNVIDYTRNHRGFTPAAVDRKVTALQRAEALCQSHGAAFVMLVPPNKHTIYNEFLPEWLHIRSPRRLPDAVLEKAQQMGLPFLYPKDALLAQKAQEAPQGRHLYYKDDSHWNNQGALTAFSQLWQSLQAQRPSLPPLLDYLTLKAETKDSVGDLVKIGKYADGLKDSETYSLHIAPEFAAAYPKQGKVLFISDSFGAYFTHLLQAVFTETVVVHNLTKGYDLEALLEQHKPDVVIYEVVERMFPQLP